MARNNEYDVVGVIDRIPGRAGRVAKQHSIKNHAETNDLSQVSWINDVDAVTVATSPFSHYRIIKQALQMGKHVLTEKPFTMTLSEGTELVKLAKARGLCLAIVHNFQFARSTKKLLTDLSAGRIGTIRSVNAIQLGNPNRRLPKWYEELPLGLFYDESPHLLYLMRLVAGEIELSQALTFPSSMGLKTPARIDAMFRSPLFDGPTWLHCNFESPVSEWYLAIFGEKRLAIVDVFRDIYLSLPNDGEHNTRTVFRTSVTATWQHFFQHVTSGLPHLTGRLSYGNEEVFSRFRRAVDGAIDDLAPIGPESAVAVLSLQHAIINNQSSWHELAVEEQRR